MLKPRTLLLIFLLLLSFTWLSSSGIWKRAKTSWTADKPEQHKLAEHSLKKLKLKAAEAKLFVTQKGYNDVICLLADMSLPSGQNRFFVYDFKRDTLIIQVW